MPDLLLELRSEEIPARMQRKAAGDLQKLVTSGLVDAGLTYEAARAYWTPRRLALDVRGVTARSADLSEERKGPRTDAPQKAIDGFLRGAGLDSADQAEIRTDPKKGEFYVAVIDKPGRPAEDIIAELMPEVIRGFPWPKSMRWGPASARPGSLRWVRPLQSILCTFGPETEDPQVIAFEIDGLRSSNITYGHRFMVPEAITVKRFDDYVAKLDKARVVLDADRRKDIILTDARNLAFAGGLELVEDEGLLEEVAGLVEWPVVLMGEFEEAFLQIPPEVIRLTIRANQKCFVCRYPSNKEGDKASLSNRFVLVSNIEATDGGVQIAAGNGRVVRARLSDALYFWNTDQADLPDLGNLAASADKLALDLRKPLDQRMARLDNLAVTFHAKLGTQGERVQRITDFAGFIAKKIGADPDLATRAALLAKADLATEAVGEFPELQGLMGRRYADLQGEQAPVAEAIEMHYRPQGPNDTVPGDPVSVAVALADKLDTLIGFWTIDEKPTGSKDPYALRRAALGVIRIVLENGIELPLRELISERPGQPAMETSVLDDLIAFFHDRLTVYLRDKGARHDLIDSVLTEQSDDLLTVVRKVEALAAFLETEEGRNLLAGTKRAANIVNAERKKGAEISTGLVDPSRFESDQETVLFDAAAEARAVASAAIARSDFTAAMHALSGLRQPIDAFFDTVLVNADDTDVRSNRLALLESIREATGAVADFSKIAG